VPPGDDELNSATASDENLSSLDIPTLISHTASGIPGLTTVLEPSSLSRLSLAP